MDPHVRAALIVFDEVVHELAELNKLLQRRNLSPIEAFQFGKARISKLCLLYLGEMAHWSNEVCEFMDNDSDMAPILRFVERLWLHLESHFSRKRADRLEYI